MEVPKDKIRITPWEDFDPDDIQADAEACFNPYYEHPIIDQIRRSEVLRSNPAISGSSIFEGVASSEILEWDLPGKGSSKPNCGTYIRSKTYGCRLGHENHAVINHCDCLTCRICWAGAVRSKAVRIAETLRKTDQLYNGMGYRHVVVSPPQD